MSELSPTAFLPDAPRVEVPAPLPVELGLSLSSLHDGHSMCPSMVSARAFGLNSLKITRHKTPDLADCDGQAAERIDGIESVQRLEKHEKGLPRRLWSRSARMLLNVHSLRADLTPDLNAGELVPLIRPSETQRIPISPVTMTQLTQVLRQSAGYEGKPFVLSGCSAEMPSSPESQETAEAVVNLSVHGDHLFDVSRFAQGGEPGSDEVTVSRKESADSPLYVLAQWGVFENRPAPLVMRVTGEQITPEKITQMARSMGIEGPFAIQIVVEEGTVDTRAIRDLPTEATDITGLVNEHMASPQIVGRVSGSGIQSDTPYSEGGHIHCVSADHTRGGHFNALTEGSMVISFSPVEFAVYGEYDPRG